MWLAGAAQDAAGSGSSEIIIAIGGLLATVITAASAVIVALINSKKSASTTPSPPSPEDHTDWVFARERIAVLDQRADDADLQREIQDRRLDQIERHLDLDRPEWRFGNRRR